MRLPVLHRPPAVEWGTFNSAWEETSSHYGANTSANGLGRSWPSADQGILEPPPLTVGSTLCVGFDSWIFQYPLQRLERPTLFFLFGWSGLSFWLVFLVLIYPIWWLKTLIRRSWEFTFRRMGWFFIWPPGCTMASGNPSINLLRSDPCEGLAI